MNSIDKLRKDLDAAAKIKDSAERSISVAAVISEALKSIGQEPILVGGAAVEFYTQGQYSTADIDMVTDGGPEAIQIMKQLGFEKVGKDFIDKKRGLYIEFPGNSLKPNEVARPITVGLKSVLIISLEDLIVDRLCAFKFWQSGIDGVNTLLLLEMGPENEIRLKQRAIQEDVLDALDAVKRVQQQIIRKKLSPNQASKLLEEEKMKLKI